MRRALPAPLASLGSWVWILVALCLFGIAGAAAFYLPPFLLFAIVAAGVAVLTWLLVPEAVIAVLLLARSSVDGFMELFTLFGSSALSMNLAGAVNSLAVGLGALALVRRMVRREPLLVAAPGWTYALFLVVCLLSIPGSVDPVLGVKEWARLASGLAIYLLVADVVHDERSARRFLAVMLISSLVPLTLGWFQVVTGSGYFFLGAIGTEFAFRPQSTFAHPGALGSYLVILLTLAASLYFSAPSSSVRAVLLAWAGVAGGLLVMAMARTQWLGMIVAAMTVGLLKRRKLALLTLALVFLLLAAVPLLRERLMASDSVTWRLSLWEAARDLAWPPTMLGLGLATAPWHVNQLLPKVDSTPHNDYLKVGLEMGVLGIVSFLAWLLALVRYSWRAYRRAELRAVSWRALGLLAIAFAGVVMSMTDNYLGYTSVQWYLWAYVALVPPEGRWPGAGLASPVKADFQSDTIAATS